nr:hypothetical protein [Tanacetum cinerariifolium]
MAKNLQTGKGEESRLRMDTKDSETTSDRENDDDTDTDNDKYGTGPHLHVYISSKATRSGLKLTRGPLLEYGTWPYLPVCSSSKATQSGLKLTGFKDEDEDKDDIKGLIWVDNHIANKREKSGQM